MKLPLLFSFIILASPSAFSSGGGEERAREGQGEALVQNFKKYGQELKACESNYKESSRDRNDCFVEATMNIHSQNMKGEERLLFKKCVNKAQTLSGWPVVYGIEFQTLLIDCRSEAETQARLDREYKAMETSFADWEKCEFKYTAGSQERIQCINEVMNTYATIKLSASGKEKYRACIQSKNITDLSSLKSDDYTALYFECSRGLR